ncbi:uncharacterized protein LOC128437688 [Pleuronectes platessa]|uniref:uncharacterized protein LOC128437688 n=1 Tax=Pleuronectes platessa TaxID=8262 RepID=UPI00232A33D0|nr:uncharacterized protein LOC128437688 [Pleuronectes platessa]
MGNVPSESNMGNRLRCIVCDKVLPPCHSFNDLYQTTIHGQHVHVFNGGEYYRQVGYNNQYKCQHCFYKPIRDEEQRKREEERRREEERKREEQRKEEERKREQQRQEEERKREQQRQEEERKRKAQEAEKRRQEELNQRLEESKRQAEEHEESTMKEELVTKRRVLISHLDEFDAKYESDYDDLLETLSSKCSIPVSDLSLVQLSADQLGSILTALDNLLFDEWISAPPSLSTLQHAQVLITELCALSLEISEGVSLKGISNHVQSLVSHISQSACNVSESFLLTQALYLNLMHFFTDPGSCDAAFIAKQWAEQDLTAEDLFLIEFLGTLTTSLQSAVGRASTFILKMEIQCLELLLSTLKHLNGKERHVGCIEILLRIVQTSKWTPTEAVTLLKVLSEKYKEDAPITEVLTLVQVYDLSPEWTDDSGHSVTQALDVLGPERFLLDFCKTLRKQDESSLDSALAELKTLNNLDESVVTMIKNITNGVLKYSENAPKGEPFMRESFKSGNLNTNEIQNSLCQLCKAVSDTKGWWPTVVQMLRWCVLVLTEKTATLGLVGVKLDPCVTAMFAATKVLMGKKVDIVLSSNIYSLNQTKEWSDFYKHLGISLNTNLRKDNTSLMDVYEADIVYGTMDDFVSDYLQCGLKGMEAGSPLLSRGFLIEDRCLSASYNLELSVLKENDALVFAADTLKSLMGIFYSEEMELRDRFIKALFLVLHSNLNKRTDEDSKVIAISQKCTGKDLPSNKVYILSILEKLLHEFSGETECEKQGASLVGNLCLEILFSHAGQFQMVSNLTAQKRWPPEEVIALLVTLTDHHHDKDCISIMKILHLIETYQVSSKWTDGKNQSLLELLSILDTKKVMEHLDRCFEEEEIKSLDTLFDEIRQMKNIDEKTLEKSYTIIKGVQNMIKSGEIKKHTNLKQAKKLSHSTKTEDLQEILAVLCNAVHVCIAEEKWWPRATQLTSWCFLALSDTGKLLEMGTGEGKSCVIAMFAALRVLRGEKVDVVSSSSVLCQRDAEEWNHFYKYFDITADTNTNKTKDEDRKKCYQKDVVYGTIETFAADHLRQIFEMKDVRTDRSYQCIIIDEVDSLLLDQGVQLTYLSSPMVSMQHLNVILAMIWGHASQYGFLSTGHITFVQGPPCSFYKSIFDSIDMDGIDDPMDVLHIAEESGIVPKGFTEEMYNSEKDKLFRKLKTVSQDDVIDFFQKIEQFVPYGFTVYTLDDNGLLSLRKSTPYNNPDIPELTFLVLDDGLCSALYDSEEVLANPITEFILEKIQYTPCTNNTGKISIPGFLKNLIESKLPVWVQNAFLAKRLRQGREYVVENDCVCPVDYRSTGIVELSKKWGDGLQQFVEIKHQIKMSTISTVTNFISNLSFFEKYNGKIYGTTGTLGSEKDMLFLQDLYPNLSACKMPTFNRRKLFEVKGNLETSAEEWKSKITHVVMDQICPNSFREGRAALVICETITKAKELYETLKSVIPGEIILYSRSDKDSLSKIDKKLDPGDVIVATNLAGRGTNIKVSKKVNKNGGLFVVLSFLSENTRVELQAFGRTARKGKPGSAQIIMTTDHVQESLKTVSSLEEAKETRNRLAAERINYMMADVTEMKLREDLFAEYCKTLHGIYRNTDGDEQRVVVAIMNEFWGIWLQTKSEEIDNLKRNELEKSLKADLSVAQSQSQSQTSPCSSIYHYIKFGNLALGEKKWDVSMKLFEKAMGQDESWAAIAFYNHAYCSIKQQKGDYLTTASNDLKKAQESLKYLSEECLVCLQFVKIASAQLKRSEQPTSLEKQLTTKCNLFSYFDKNICEAIEKLKEIKDKGRDATTKKLPMFSLVSSTDEDLQTEAYNLYSKGLEYVFSVEEQPRFPWEALLVFCLGILQIVGGALLTAFTCGALAQVGIGLIVEGVSDCITGIESMITGEFSWQSWAIEKAISIGISLIGFGVGKLVTKGFKAAKMLVKAVGKKLKALPKFFSKQVKEGLSVVTKTNMKNAVKQTAKKMAEEIISYAFGKAEDAVLQEILKGIKNQLTKDIANDVKTKMEKDPLAGLVDSILLSHLEDKKQMSDLLQDKNRKSKLLGIFKQISKTALEPFYADLEWQNKLNSQIATVIDSAASEAKGKTLAVLRVIQGIHMASLAAEATSAVLSLSSQFFSNLHKELNTFKENNNLIEKVKRNDLSASEMKILKDFKQDLVNETSALLADALVEVFHQKFSSHFVSSAVGQVNNVIGDYVRTGLKSEKTEDKLRAGQNNRYISHMSVDMNSKRKQDSESGKRSESHAEKIKDSSTATSILDIRVLSETTGTKVVILTQDSHGKLTKMQELSPSTKSASQTVTLIYTPKSSQHPDGHYDVSINNKTVKVTTKEKSSLFHALAQGMKPKATKEEIALEAGRLRSLEADILVKHSDQWEPFLKYKERTDEIRGGDWYMAKEAGLKETVKENKKVIKDGKVKKYNDWVKNVNSKPSTGQFIKAAHQPPASSISQAGKLNQNSKLAKAMLEVVTKSTADVKNYKGLGLPTIYVPTEIQREFPSTTTKQFRKLLARTISQDNVVSALKLTILGAMPRFKFNSAKNYRDFRNNRVSKTRLAIFEKNFEQHSKDLVNKWFNHLQDKGVMTKADLDTLTAWINNKVYENPTDPHRKQVSNLL